MNATDMQQSQVWVQSIHDDKAVPLTGLVVGWEDEDRVWVIWGESAWSYRGHVGPLPAEARIEYMDELTPRRRDTRNA